MGEDRKDLARNYAFHAVLDGGLVAPQLERQGSTSAFLVTVDGVGSFKFRAQPVASPVPSYAGAFPLMGPLTAFWQLTTGDHQALETAARDLDFYFAAFSPVIAEAPDAPLL
jgi:hypothetical protein